MISAGETLNPLTPRKPHYEPKVKRVIYLHMSGGPPHLDLFDYKPELVKWNEKPCPDEFLKGRKFAFTSGGMGRRPWSPAPWMRPLSRSQLRSVSTPMTLVQRGSPRCVRYAATYHLYGRNGPHDACSARVFAAMQGMVKLDAVALERAAGV